MPNQPGVALPTFTDDTVNLSMHENYETIAATTLQKAVMEVGHWTRQSKIQLNSAKSSKVDFSLRLHGYCPVTINDETIPVRCSR